MLRTLCVIPARLNSTRLPRKMLAMLGEQCLIQKTYLQARQCSAIDQLVVATDSDEIASVVKEVGGEVVMTPADIQTGSDRVAYVAKEYSDMDVIINLQGDEPFIQPETLTELIAPYHNGENPVMATIGNALDFEKEYLTPDMVKVIIDQQGYAIYFSRAPIPYLRQDIRKNGESLPVLHHIGLYAYQRDFLLHYTKMPQTPLEKTELLEQLRALENGYKIKVSETTHRTLEINTPAELEIAQKFFNVR
jgi:3-deoxy-manno-octulosonate cytidylyltransferase (CMP-KDO synthetase)